MKKHRQSGSVHLVIIIILAVALIGALGLVFWQNFIVKKDIQATRVATSSEAAKKLDETGKEKATEPKNQTPAVTDKYTDFRVDKKDATGITVAVADDTAKLTGASQKLKDYLAREAGKEFTHAMYDHPVATTFIVDRVYGDYAVGTLETGGAYMLWGPKDGTGAIERVGATQNIGFNCDELRAAAVPKELVDGKCADPSKSDHIAEYSL